MLKTITLAFSIFLSLQSFAQSNFDQFMDYLNTGDTLKQREILEEWNEESPNDAELYVCYFNYYFFKSQTERITLNSAPIPDDQDVLLLKDSSDQIAGFIGSRIDYDQSNLKQAFAQLDKGIEAYPNRLDMRFGMIYALSEIKHWERYTKEVIATVNYSAKNNNAWTWMHGEKKSEGREMLLSSLQNYISQLYNANDDALMQNIRDISEAVLVHYPDHIESLSNLAVSHLVEGNYGKAIDPLLKAEKLDPEDYIVLNNIAYAYLQIENTDKAIEYYEKVIEFGDGQAKAQAEEKLKELKP